MQLVSYAEVKVNSALALFGTVFIVPTTLAQTGNRQIATGALAGTVFAQSETNAHPGANNNHQSTFTEELQFQGRSADDRLVWQAGGYMERSEPLGPQEQYAASFVSCTNVYTFQCTPFTLQLPTGPRPIGSISIARNNYWFRNYAVYAQGTYKLSDQFSVTAGARYTWDSVRTTGDGVTGTPSPAGLVGTYRCSQAPTPTDPLIAANLINNGACFRTFTQASSRPTWTIDLDYKPTEDILAYLNYSRGYRGGGVNQSNVNNETWAPEKVDTFEAGLKTTWRGAM